MSSFGQVIHINLFGESHGESIGLVINNLPAGLTLDKKRIEHALFKRRPKSNLSTARQEKDPYKIVSGYFNDKTTGTPLTILIPNEDTRSRDYTPEILRPSHADFTAKVKYNDSNDYRGGGHFSGRLTTPIVILGAICESILEEKGIIVSSHIASIKDISDTSFADIDITEDILKKLNLSDFPVVNSTVKAKYEAQILDAKHNLDSVGGTIETMIHGIPAGYGYPFFDSVESILAHLLFSVPAVKGVEFGKGFAITKLFGSEANDSFILENGQIKTSSNNSGGIQGGISNGMPITFKVAIKPTASIAKPQKTVNIETMEETTLELKGRHDPAIVHRVIHVINAITNYAVLELILRTEGTKWIG
ncbi:chorismate synthase [Candidatus Xianfuyuplasma coldseepsis]|uniref:Chorismate synthase n=1 Tax=Candidatus Xianfuyuplasma coldseepsis TaxID=2782163 RepID=A0A7L7KQD8_9MOLU|nr:chorismate synthase [Xianfuyuplasma coldseepsis]QMS84933.1 chorismate synthase [Xianfuyuplasma coldseepsis]